MASPTLNGFSTQIIQLEVMAEVISNKLDADGDVLRHNVDSYLYDADRRQQQGLSKSWAR